MNKQFEEWLKIFDHKGMINAPIELRPYDFELLPSPMRWGMLLDFFDSVNIDLDMYYDEEFENYGQEHGKSGPREILQYKAKERAFKDLKDENKS